MQQAFKTAEGDDPCQRAKRIFDKAFRSSFLSDDSRKIPCDFARVTPTIAQFERAIRLCPNGHWGHLARENRCEVLAHFAFYAARGAEQRRRIKDVGACREAVRRDPDRAGARRPLVVLAVYSERWSECVRRCDEALALFDKWSITHGLKNAHGELNAFDFFVKTRTRCLNKQGTYFPRDCAEPGILRFSGPSARNLGTEGHATSARAHGAGLCMLTVQRLSR
jgi:hypothetical protein